MNEKYLSDLEYFDKKIFLYLKRKQYRLVKKIIKQRNVFLEQILLLV
jgi:hypothetical protein